MIVKIHNNSGGFLIYDNASDINYRKIVLKDGKITKVGEGHHSLANDKNVEYECFIGGSAIYTEITFRQNDRHYRIMTDRSIYLMNNEGKTIEKVY